MIPRTTLARVELTDQRGALGLRQLEHREQRDAAALTEEVEGAGAEVVVVQNERRLACGEAWKDEGLVIDYGDGGPWLPPTFSTYWARFAAKNGLDGVNLHTLRHGTATLLLAAGVPDAVVIQNMGHADTVILRRYQEVVPDLMRDATARLEALLADS